MPTNTKCKPYIGAKHLGAHLNWKSLIITDRPKCANLLLKFLLQSVVIVFLLYLGDIRSSFDYSNIGNSNCFVYATSINYGISQQPITDISQLMPKLCQNQTVICEGSFCIPNVRKCVCDLRMPVQFGRFCLRQVDMETKCFVTNQCNHTIKDAVCIDVNSNSVLDYDSSKFKLDQWQQLNELRQLSQTATGSGGGANSKDVPNRPQFQTIITTTESVPRAMFLFDNGNNENTVSGFNFEARNDVILSNARNSPYEINYNTPELLVQNHTGRKQNSTNNHLFNNFKWPIVPKNNQVDEQSSILSQQGYPTPTSASYTTPPEATTSPEDTVTKYDSEQKTGARQTTESSSVRPTEEAAQQTASPTIVSSKPATLSSTPAAQTTTTTALPYSSDLASRKKMVIKSNWPPGICSCPFGFMFDSMLRKCLALSLADSHCQVDSDCKQIPMTHCSQESKKCQCDEPLEWNQKESACVRPRQVLPVWPEDKDPNVRKETGSVGFVENLLPPLILAKLLPDYTMLLLIFVFVVIIGTLIILKLTVKCFSSSNSALISPKTKKKPNKQAGGQNLPPRSPYATIRRPEHKPSSQLSNFTQATRGRILNYDFEQEGPNYGTEAPSPQVPYSSGATLQRAIIGNNSNNNKGDNQAIINGSEKMASTMMRPNKGHKHHHQSDNQFATLPKKSLVAKGEEVSNDDDQIMELNDNISVSQMESGESKSDNSILTIPGPPTIQQPPYMLASAMKGQGSAIAAAAAAVANKRMQMAQKKSLEQQSSCKLANGSPVFL